MSDAVVEVDVGYITGPDLDVASEAEIRRKANYDLGQSRSAEWTRRQHIRLLLNEIEMLRSKLWNAAAHQPMRIARP